MDETKNRRTMSQFQKFSYETNKRLRDKYVNIQKYELGEEKRRQNVLENRRSKMRKMMDYLRRKSFSSYNECNNPNSRDKSSCSPKNMKSMNSPTVSKQDASEEFRVASNLVQLSELHSEVHEESITSPTPTSSHTPRKPLKFVISPQPNERESTSNRLPTSSGSVLKIAEDPVTPVTNISACSTQVHSNQVRSTEVRKSSDENPPNSSGTDDEISSITLDISNPVCQFASCEVFSNEFSIPSSTLGEDNDSIIFPEDSETSQTDENIPHFEIGSTPKYTRSILKSRSISPRTYLDSTYECFQDEFADTLYRLRDSVELATDRFQIGYVPSHYGGSSCTSEYVLQSCSTSHESEIIESPRTPRKTVRFADETTDFAQSCPTSVNPIFSNVFPLKIASDIDVIPSAVRSDTLTPTQPSLEKIAENNPVHSYGSLSSMSSNFISISIGFTSAQSLKPFNTNPVSMHNLDIVNSNSEISENPNPKISLKTECTTEHSIKEKKEQTLEYERLKSHNQRTASSARKSQSKTNVNSRRISKSQGYADLLIGRPNLHKDFLIPRQQLLSYRTSLSPLFSHQMSGYQSITSSKLSCQDSNHPDAEGNSSNGGLPCSLNALLSDIAAPLEVNQNCFRVHNPCSTNSFENQRIYDTMKDIDIHVKAQCQNAPASTYTHNDNERKFYRDVDPPDYEGINVSFIRNEMPTTSFNPSSTAITETKRYNDPAVNCNFVPEDDVCINQQPCYSTHTVNAAMPVIQTVELDLSKSPPVVYSKNNNNVSNKNQKGESSKLLVGIRQNQNSKLSIPLYSPSTRLLSRRPRVCEPSDVNQNHSNPRMFMSAYEFESNQFEVDSQENASKISNPPKSEKPLIASNQNPLNHPKAYWFRLHNGYSGKDDFMDTENTIQNHLSTSTISHPVALNKSIDKFKSDSQNSDYDNLSVVQSIYVQNCTPESSNPIVTNLFGPKLECATYTQIHDVRGSFIEFLDSERACYYQHEHQQQQPEDESKISLTPTPVRTEAKIFHQSPYKKKSKTPSLLSMEEEQLIKSLERLNKRLNDILIRQKK